MVLFPRLPGSMSLCVMCCVEVLIILHVGLTTLLRRPRLLVGIHIQLEVVHRIHIQSSSVVTVTMESIVTERLTD